MKVDFSPNRGGGIMEEERRHASPEGLRSEKDAFSIVKHDENEKSTTQTIKN